VSDIEAAVRELEERDVRFIDYGEGPLQTTGHIAQIGPARAAWFRDPDGNTLGLRPGVAVVHPGGNEPADSSDVVGALPPLPKTRRRRP
jgi:hypothetical protein